MDVLAGLQPVSDHYATLPVAEAFDWASCADSMEPGEWYLVAFRSVRREDADEGRLEAYDEWAHQEAAVAPGFVHYFKGPRAPDGSCLSFCLWNSRAEARAAAARPAHAAAAALTGETYRSYVLEFLRVSKATANGPLTFEPYDRPTVPLPTAPMPATVAQPAS